MVVKLPNPNRYSYVQYSIQQIAPTSEFVAVMVMVEMRENGPPDYELVGEQLDAIRVAKAVRFFQERQNGRTTDYRPPQTTQEIVGLQLENGDWDIVNRFGGFCGVARAGDDITKLVGNLTGKFAEMHKRGEIRMPEEKAVAG